MTKGVSLRDAVTKDLKALWDLNQSEVPHVGSIDRAQMRWYFDHAEHVRVVAAADGALLGFMIALGPGSPYDSPNYQWFCERYDAFVYVDRLAVAPAARGQGVGRRLYQDVAERWASRAEYVTCEVNTRPPNPGSLAFHQRLGFTVVETVRHAENKEVAMMRWPLGGGSAPARASE